MYKRIYKQAFILGFSNILVKILGLIFIFPFARMVGKEGTNLYTYAYVPYIFFTDITTLGLIPGTSKLVSKIMANNEEGKASYLLRKTTILMIIIGVISFLLLNALAVPYVKLQLSNKVTDLTDIITAIRVVSLSLLVTPLLCFFRGFLQGTLRVVPSSISIIIEQFIRVTIILISTYYIIKVRQMHYKYAVFIAVGAAFVGSLVSLIFLSFFTKKYRIKEQVKFEYKRTLVRVCISIGFTTIFLSVYQMIDSVTFMKYCSSPHVLDYYRAFSFETSRLIIIPIILAQSLASAILPNLTRANEQNAIDEKTNGISKILFLSNMMIIPMVFIFFIFADPIYHFFYQGDGIGVSVLKYSSILIASYGMNKVLIGIMQGINKGKILILATLLSFGLKYLGNVILIRNICYKGVIVSSFIASIFAICISVYVLNKEKIIKYGSFILKVLMHIVAGIVAMLCLRLFRNIIAIDMHNYKTYIIGFIIYIPFFYLIYLLILKIISISASKINSNKSLQ